MPVAVNANCSCSCINPFTFQEDAYNMKKKQYGAVSVSIK